MYKKNLDFEKGIENDVNYIYLSSKNNDFYEYESNLFFNYDNNQNFSNDKDKEKDEFIFFPKF